MFSYLEGSCPTRKSQLVLFYSSPFFGLLREEIFALCFLFVFVVLFWFLVFWLVCFLFFVFLNFFVWEHFGGFFFTLLCSMVPGLKIPCKLGYKT